MAQPQDVHKGLTYPFGKGWAPKGGCVFKVADSVHWLHMPMPGSLDRINLWLLEDGDGWTIVDTGLGLPSAEEVWEDVSANTLDGKPVKRVIVTHMHPDHIGMAGWLTRRFDCELWTSREEYLMCRNLVSDTGKEAPSAALDFYHAAGMSHGELENYKAKFGNFGRMVSQLPDSFRRLQDRETILIDNRYWQVVMGNGHSPEHACLYCPALKLLISGDQVIPRISSNVSVWPTEPHGDPLADWLHSCKSLVKLLPTDLLVLPAHQEPFYGLHTRLNQLIESHTKALHRLFDHLSEPRTVVDCFSMLFRSEIGNDVKIMAIGEAQAHLNYLLHRQMITRERRDGVDYYQQVPATGMVDNPVVATA
jgi:glyoxylase-like metal-dependent hydrolase (beta-lactamase superfamily II)